MSNEELAQLIHDGNGERQLELWEQIKRYAMKTANRWLRAFPLRCDVEFDDLMSAAYIAMCEAMAAIPAECSDVIRRRYFDGQTIKRIEAERQTTPNEIKSREYRGLRAMQRNTRLRGFNCYSGTGLSSFRRTGASVQESYLIFAENVKKCTHKKETDQ